MQSLRPSLLLVDDDAAQRHYLRTLLSGAGYRIEEAATGHFALTAARRTLPATIVLELDLPDIDGQDLLQEMRQWLKTPIVVLSTRDEPDEKIAALDRGADDYLTKPFNSGELLARIRTAIRHASATQSGAESLEYAFGDTRVDLLSRRVCVRGTDIHLTPLEFKLLATLVRYAGKILSHQFLLKEVWGVKERQEPHTLRVFMAGLRRKIEADSGRPCYLLTEQGVGYRLACENGRSGKT